MNTKKLVKTKLTFSDNVVYTHNKFDDGSVEVLANGKHIKTVYPGGGIVWIVKKSS